MRVLVTGGAGYIGSHTLLELAAAGHTFFVLDNFDNSSPEALVRVSELIKRKVPFAKADIRDVNALDAVMSEFSPDAVIHFAGLKSLAESADRPLDYYDVNIGGTLALLNAMEKCGCRRIVFSSSAVVYGMPQYLPIDEDHPCNPASVYGRTKHMAESILCDWQATHPDAAVVLLRYFNPVGADISGRIGENPSSIPVNLMPYVTQVAIGQREKLLIYGDDYDTHDGTGVRDFIHVTDLAGAHIAALRYAQNRMGSTAFNIGTGQGYSVLDIIKAFEVTTDLPVPYYIAARRPGDISTSLADPTRANTVLEWRARMSLKEMCRSAWAWQVGNPNGFGSS